ncbi:LysR family transcriptional regulator [Magnetospira sp. QH-2]|uniref:LysR family transcriptional regulator n=1 Tax=Magnetospira sp. (strain QH-2) TaxID=1288970 RepID=UPI0003E8176F|nr:LysR family transcriptional regulator [Magnetospira sp. QH-2]CCQ75214.1 putative LysR family Transcriptional regulator [Magnetospira sp. QH-2]
MEYKNLPDIRGWAALRAVVERGSVSAAAEALSVGQPAVTKRLRALEACYGLPLTERRSGRLHLTEAGEKVYLLAVQTLDRQLSLRHEMLDMAQGKTTLHLDVTIAIGEHFLPRFLLAFSERHPQYRVDSRLIYGRQIQTNLANGISDLALLERAPDHPDLLVQKWMDDELLLVCGPRHPLANEEMIPAAMLHDLSYVLREPGSSARLDLDEALDRIGFSGLNVALEVGATDALMNVLMPGSHVSFLPRFAVEDFVAQGRLRHIRVGGFRIMRTLWIARHRANIDHPVADAFISVIRDL